MNDDPKILDLGKPRSGPTVDVMRGIDELQQLADNGRPAILITCPNGQLYIAARFDTTRYTPRNVVNFIEDALLHTVASFGDGGSAPQGES